MSSTHKLQLATREVYFPSAPEIIGDGDGRRIHGRANTADLDRWGTVIEPARMRPVRGVVSLLLEHDRHSPIGAVERIDHESDRIEFDARITSDEAWELVRNGALTGVSIGFLAHDWYDDDDVTFVTDWELIEISLTSTPANVMASILSIRSTIMSDVFRDRQRQAPRPAELAEPAPSPAPTVPGRTIYPPAVPSAEPPTLSQRVFRDLPATMPLPALHTHRVPARFSGSVIATRLAGGTLTGIEGEICGEMLRRSYAPTHGDVRIPAAVFTGKRALSTSAGSGAALSPDAYLQEMLDDVSASRRWGTLSPRIGFTIVTTMRETIHIPKRLTVLDADFIGKDTEAPESETTFDEDVLSPKYVGAHTVIRRSAIRYADPAADDIITADIRRGLDDRVDNAVLFGVLSATVPGGLLMTRPATSTLDKAGATIEPADLFWIKNLQMGLWKMDDANAGLRWVGNPALVDRLRVTSKKKIPSGEAEWFGGVMPFDSGEGMLLGMMLIQSGRMRASAEGHFDLHLVAPEMGVVCYFGGAAVDLLIDPYTQSRTGSVAVTAFLDVNTLARDPNIDAAIRNASIAPDAGGSPLKTK